jgi:aryl-alcohol dehydrogenase-like predicted oxidoreductase
MIDDAPGEDMRIPILAAPPRRLGAEGPLVSALGLGCMGMSEMYGPTDDARSVRVINAALDAGVRLVDTAAMYGEGHNEELVGRAIRGRRDDAVVATKFGIRREGGRRWNDNSPVFARASAELSLRRLGVEALDVFIIHRLDGTTPIEESVGALSELVQEGKVRHIGLSEVSAATLRRAHAVHPVAVVQNEFSLWTQDVMHDGVLATARELGVGVVAYSPLGRGFFTGRVRDVAALADDDFRRSNPRFAAGHLEANLALLAPVERLAEKLGTTPAAVALAWLLAQGDDVVPIPGMNRPEELRDNIVAAALRLDPDDVAMLTETFRPGAVVGERYHAAIMPDAR